MEQMIWAYVLVLIASVLQGTFGLGMKKVEPLAWEAWWLIFSLVSLLLIPWVWAVVVVPDLGAAIVNAPPAALVKGVLFGLLWGIGGLTFGLAIKYLGISLTYGIVMGLASSIGALAPLAQTPDLGGNPALPFVLVGVAVMVVGVGVSAYAGVRREQMQVTAGKEIIGIKKGGDFRIGLMIVVISGVFSAFLNIGFVNAAPVARTAESFGALPRNATLAVWVVVLLGGFLVNAGFAVFLLCKNHTWGFLSRKSLKTPGFRNAFLWSLLTGIIWFADIGMYGQGAALMGEWGPVIGWPILLGLGLVIGNVWAARSGEWEGVPGPFRIMLGSVALIIAAVVVLGYANSLT